MENIDTIPIIMETTEEAKVRKYRLEKKLQKVKQDGDYLSKYYIERRLRNELNRDRKNLEVEYVKEKNSWIEFLEKLPYIPHSRIDKEYPVMIPSAVPLDYWAMTFPLYASPYLKGLRFYVEDSKLYYITIKGSIVESKNLHLKKYLNKLNGIEGVVTTDPKVSVVAENSNYIRVILNNTLRDIDDLVFYIFDTREHDASYSNRFKYISKLTLPPFMKVVNNQLIENLDEVKEYEEKVLSMGYQGIMLKSPYERYYRGRIHKYHSVIWHRKKPEIAVGTIYSYVIQRHPVSNKPLSLIRYLYLEGENKAVISRIPVPIRKNLYKIKGELKGMKVIYAYWVDREFSIAARNVRGTLLRIIGDNDKYNYFTEDCSNYSFKDYIEDMSEYSTVN